MPLIFTDSNSNMTIHPRAIVHPNAKIGEGTTIGADAIVDEFVEIGDRCDIRARAIITGADPSARQGTGRARAGWIPEPMRAHTIRADRPGVCAPLRRFRRVTSECGLARECTGARQFRARTKTGCVSCQSPVVTEADSSKPRSGQRWRRQR